MNWSRVKYLTIALLMLVTWQAKAQYDAHMSHYWALKPLYNPAAIGLAGKLNIDGAYSSQLSGFTRNAKTMYFGADMPIMFVGETHNVGLGFLNETIGLFSNQRFYAQYSYRTKLFGGRFSGGIQLGLLSEKFDGSKVDFGDAEGSADSDPAFPSSQVEGSGFDLGAGLYYQHPYFYAGLAATHLNSPKIMLGENNEFEVSPTYYLMGGCNIQLKNPLLSIQPSLMLQTDGLVYRADITGRLTYTYNGRSYYGGLGYSPTISCTFLVGCTFQGVNFGYAYELPTTEVGLGNGGHNLCVGYQMDLDLFKKGKNRHKSIRIL